MQDFRVSSEAVIRKVFWVDWFHKAPHINLTLRKVNSTFDPFSDVYQESLGIIGSVPAGILILTLLVLLLYLLTRCCDNRPRKSTSITCLKVTCVLLAFCTLGAIGVSVWGNDEVHNGLSESIYSLGTISNMVQSLTNKTRMFDDTVKKNLEPELNLFRETIEKHKIQNRTARNFIMESLYYMKGNVSEVLLLNVEDIRTKLNRADLKSVFETLGVGELIRWISTYALTGLLMTVVLVVPLGVARHSRCTLITFSVLGLISIIVCWILSSVYFVVVVGISDWCMDPNPFVEAQLGQLLPRDVTYYYVRCDPTRPSPFTRYLTHAQHSADVIESSLDQVVDIADSHYPQGMIHPRLDRLETYVRESQRTLGAIAALLECQSMHQQYRNMITSVCNQSVSGFVYLLLSAAGSGLFFTILVWFASHTWIYLNHKSDGRGWSERDAFGGDSAPLRNGGHSYGRPIHSHTPPQTPPFPGTLSRMYPGDHIGPGVMLPPAGSLGRPRGGNNGGVPPVLNTATLSRGGHPYHGHHSASHPGNHHHTLPHVPNQGQYATLSKQCKTLESSDFY